MIQIFAINKEGEREEVSDLYWFEENGVHDFGGEGHFENFTFEILVDGVKVNHAADRKAGD